METEKAGHETEGSLILAQLNADSLLGAKIQNGSPASPEGGPTLQVNGEGSWGHRKAGINVAKRHRENCGGGGGGLDQGPYAVNGELKHGLGGDRHRQPKKLRPDGETNGEEEDADMGSWDKKDVVACGGEALLADNAFPELTEAGEFKPKPDKRNCSSFSNGDIFSLPRNNGRQMPMANGATPPPTSMEGTPGDLLERTLSQYYPEQVSIARQCGGSQPDDGGSLARCSPSLPSGYPLSEPAPDSQGSNGYNAGAAPYLMNGYSNSYGGVERQGQQQQQERQHPSYPLQGLQEQGRPLGQRGSHAMSGATQSTGAGSPRQNGGTDRYPAELDPQQQGVFGQNHGQGAAFPGEQSDPLLAEEGGGGGGGFGSYPGPGQRGEDPGCSSHQTQPPPLQRGFQYRGQAPQQQQQHHHQSGGGNPCVSDALSPSLARAPHGGGDPGPQQQQALHSGLPNGTDNPCSASPQMGWIDLNSSHGGGGGGGGGGPQTQQQMWRGFPGQTQAQPGQHGVQTDPQARGPEPDPTGRFQMRGEGFVNGPPLHDSGGFQQQQQDGRTAMSQSNPTPEWPQQGSSAVPHAQVPRPGQLPPPQGCNASDGRFGGPEQHLCEDDPDLEEILSSSFLPPPQQQQQQQQQQHQLKPRPLSHPSLYETPQQMKSPVYRPQSQPQPGQQVQPRAGSAFPDLPSPQPANNNNNGRSSAPLLQPDAGAFGYGGVDAGPPGLRESCGFNRVDAQRHYAPSPGVGGVGAGVPSPPRQHLQPYPSPSQQQHHPDPNCDQLQHRRCNPQSDYLQSTQSHGAQNQNQQQATAAAQMYIKTERHPDVSESCGQFQRVRPPAPGHPGLPGGDYHQQRHAALRMHLLQRQERLVGPPPPHHLHSPSGDFRQHGGPMMRPVKIENGPRFEPPGPQQQQMQALGGGGGGGGGGVQIKQEPNTQHPQSACEQRSILATMEQTLRQYQLSPVFERNSLAVRSPSRIKVESSGAVTILSTNTEGGGGGGGAEEMMMGAPSASAAGGMKRHLDFTPKKEALLQNFVESPLKLLDTPIRNLLDTPIKNQYDIPSCHCMEQISEKDEGPYYTHLGAAPNVPAIRETMESRSGLTGAALRIEKVVYTGKEGKSTQGCPIAKWVIRRSGEEEKLLVLVRERSGHRCQTACVVVAILIWEGIPLPMADRLYLELSETLTRHGAHTQRRCAINEERTCACQGLDPEACGASFSFGCSWSMYYNGCKFARSKIPRKFKLLGDDPKEEERLEHNLQSLATIMGPTYKQLAPDAYANQVEHEHRAPDCRLGHKEGRPFSGVTACVDFCAHAHRDLHNMQSGSTVVCTLTSQDNRQIGKIPEDEQLHVLPLYKAATTDEFGSEEGQRRKVESGAIQVFSTFRRQIRMLSEPAKSCRQKKLDAKKAAANKNSLLDTPNAKAEKAAAALQAKMKSSTYESSMAQSAAGTGPNAGPVGQPPHPPLGAAHQQLQQHQNQSALLPSYPGGPPHPAGYPRFPPGHPGNHPFPSTSKPGGMYASQQPQQPPAGPYPHSPLHLPGSPYMNGSNPALGPYAGSLNRAGPYAAGYPCNGGMPLDGYHPYYAAANSKHLDAYRQQQQQQQPPYGSPHQRYGMGFTSPPPRYGEQPGLQVNGYGGVHHPASPYSPYGPNATAPDPSQFLDGLSRPPSAHHHPHPHHHHPGLDYAAAVSKGNQLGGYPGQYLTQGPQMYPPGQDPFRMQIKTEMGLAPGLGGGDCLTPGFRGLPNGGFQSPTIKQEPGTPQTPTPAPATPQKPELWSDNEHNFLDPDIGGVAVAPTHGSILIECAKRELHATTPLKNPDRNHPKRISLVFYQHKNMNEAKHGLALWEAKMAEKAREKEEEAERNGGEAGTPSGGKSGGRKGAKREHVESASAGAEQTAEPPSKRFIQALLARSQSCVTNTYVTTTPFAFTKVTGPYSKFV